MNEELQHLGFTTNESRVYTGIHSHPLRTGAELARSLKMDKSSVYKALDELKQKGLINTSHGKSGIVYDTSSPDTLLKIHKEKEQQLKFRKSLLEDFVKDLKNKSLNERETYIAVEKGLTALQTRMEESLNCSDKLLREIFHFHPVLADPKHAEFVKQHARKRSKRKVFLQQIVSRPEQFKETFEDMFKSTQNPNKEVRLLDSTFDSKNSIRIWDDTVFILSYDDKEEFLVITIKDKFVAELMKNFYDFVWESSEATLKPDYKT